jgi:hypothetical protein
MKGDKKVSGEMKSVEMAALTPDNGSSQISS